MFTYIYICLHIYVYMYMYIYVHIYIYMKFNFFSKEGEIISLIIHHAATYLKEKPTLPSL